MKEEEHWDEARNPPVPKQQVNGCQDATASALVQRVVLLARVVSPEIHARNT
jgi:hypothetical protein